MKRTLPFVPSVIDSTQSGMSRDAYDRSIEQYEKKQYAGAFHLLLDYLNPGFRKKYGNKKGTEFDIPHGSIVVHIRLEKERLHIEADFLNLPEKGRVAMLRQVADMNINRLLLPRFVKEGDRLKMEYSCLLSESHPYKIYGVLRNMCYVGDRYDDEFCTKFGATRCYEPKVTYYSADLCARVYGAVQTVGHTALAAVKEYDAQRRYGYSWNLLGTVFYQIAYFAHPQGQLINDLEKAIDGLDEELPVAELVARGRSFLEKLLAMPKEEMERELYFVDTLVSMKRPSSLQNVQENMKDVYEEVTEAIQAKDYERVAVRIAYKFYEAYFYNDMQDDLNALLVDALERAADSSMEDAAAILWIALDKIMDGKLEGDDDDDDDDDEEDDDDEDEDDDDEEEEEEEDGEDVTAVIQQMQQELMAAMGRGDMAEYMRLAQEIQKKALEIQQKIMGGNV